MSQGRSISPTSSSSAPASSASPSPSAAPPSSASRCWCSSAATTSAATPTARTSRDRDRGAQVRRPPVPHLQRAGVGVRQPVHRLHRLPAPGLRQVPGAGLLAADEPRPDQPVLRQGPHARRGARADRRAGQRDRHRGRHQPRGEGDQPDRPPALRGVHQGLHRQAVADRPDRAERRTSSPGSRSATPSTTATSTTPTRACRSTATPRG